MIKYFSKVLIVAIVLCLIASNGFSQKVNNELESSSSSITWEELRQVYKEIVGCKPQGSCRELMSSKMLEKWLQNCKYRDPKRISNQNLNAYDFDYLSKKFKDSFAEYFNKHNIWIYAGSNLENAEGVSYELMTKMYYSNPTAITMKYNQTADRFNRQFPLEVSVKKVANQTIVNISTENYTNEAGEKVINAKEFGDYFGSHTGLKDGK